MTLNRSIFLLLGALSAASSFAPLAPMQTSSINYGTTQLFGQPSTTENEDKTQASNFPKVMATGMIAMSAVFGPLQMQISDNHIMHPTVPVANAAESRVIGELKGSGLVFKDTLVIESFDDPKVQGVTLYLSNFQRPLSERLQKDFFSDPSSAGIGCARNGPVKIADNIVEGNGGEQVFKESKSLLFKSLRVQRIYDKEKNTVVYVSFNTKLDKSDDSNNSRFKSALCAVNLGEPSAVTVAPAVTP